MTSPYVSAMMDLICVMSALPPKRTCRKGKVAPRLCNLVHCCRAAIAAMASEPYCRLTPHSPSDEDVSRQILGVFVRHRIPATGTLQRNYFFEVRDGDFQRGINKAVANNWITIDLRNRHRYQLTETGYAVGRVIDPVLGSIRMRAMSLWVKSRHLQCRKACPLLPRKQTCAAQLGMSAKCQKQTSRRFRKRHPSCRRA